MSIEKNEAAEGAKKLSNLRKQVKVVEAIIKAGEKIFATQRGYGEFKDGWEF